MRTKESPRDNGGNSPHRESEERTPTRKAIVWVMWFLDRFHIGEKIVWFGVFLVAWWFALFLWGLLWHSGFFALVAKIILVYLVIRAILGM